MMRMKAYAKVNLALDVLHKRPDGYHEVEMIMQSISLADAVFLEACDKGITVTSTIPGLACDSTNLAYRAAALLRDYTHADKGVRIHLDKHIPLAAGLAGGSSNAAVVLTGLNRLWQLDLSLTELMKLGASLGSDVPFCLSGGTMRAYGRGELLESLPPMPHCYVVLAKPRFGVSTAWVYGNYRPEIVLDRPNIKKLQSDLAAASFSGVASGLRNVLESVTIPAYPEVGRIKQLMTDYGAAALMSGSGPTVFGLVAHEHEAAKIAQQLRQNIEADVFVAETVTEVE